MKFVQPSIKDANERYNDGYNRLKQFTKEVHRQNDCWTSCQELFWGVGSFHFSLLAESKFIVYGRKLRPLSQVDSSYHVKGFCIPCNLKLIDQLPSDHISPYKS